MNSDFGSILLEFCSILLEFYSLIFGLFRHVQNNIFIATYFMCFRGKGEKVEQELPVAVRKEGIAPLERRLNNKVIS